MKRLLAPQLVVLFALAVLLVPPSALGTDFTNPTMIGLATDEGVTTPYPSVITPTGLTGSVSHVKITLSGFFWEHLADPDILVVAPNGVGVVIMSDACSFFGSTTPNTFTFDDSNVGVMPPTGCAQILLNVKPFNNEDALLCAADPDVLPAPAPPGPSSGGYPVGLQMLSVFNGIPAATAMGDWKLFIFDDCDSLTTLDNGFIQNGWTLTLTTSPTAVTVKSFIARPASGRVDLSWQTASETAVAGFNVIRTGRSGTVRVNRHLIRATRFSGASYSLADRTARPGGKYRYRLQLVSMDGTREWGGSARVDLSR